MNLSRRGFLGLGIGTAVAAIVRPEIAFESVDLGFGKAGLDMVPMFSETTLSMKEWEDSVIQILPMMQREMAKAMQNDLEFRIINGESYAPDGTRQAGLALNPGLPESQEGK
jgi:hypothetical protein